MGEGDVVNRRRKFHFNSSRFQRNVLCIRAIVYLRGEAEKEMEHSSSQLTTESVNVKYEKRLRLKLVFLQLEI